MEDNEIKPKLNYDQVQKLIDEQVNTILEKNIEERDKKICRRKIPLCRQCLMLFRKLLKR